MRNGKIAIAIHEKIAGRIDRLAREFAKLDLKPERALAELETAASSTVEDYASSEVNLGVSDGERKLAGKSIIKKRAVLKNIAADKEKKTLSGKRRSDRAGGVYRYWQASDAGLNRVYVVLS